MIKTLTAHTYEIDDIDFAIEELLGQLKLDENLLTNSVGLVSCYSEFIDSGVAQALCEHLPFPIIGTTTFASAQTGTSGLLLLNLAVLTSDDVSFSVAMSDSLSGDPAASIEDVCARATQGHAEAAKLAIAYMPLLLHVGGDQLVDLLDKSLNSTPVYGTTTIDHTGDYHTSHTLANGVASRDQLALLLMYGNVDPKFLKISVSEEKIGKQRALITKSHGNILMEVNGQPMKDYLQTLGLVEDGEVRGMNTIPFIVDMNDGSPPIARALFAFTDDGYAVCGAGVPEGASLLIGSLDYDDVLLTTEGMIKEALNDGRQDGLLIFSCIGRNIALGSETSAEMGMLPGLLDGKIPYQFTYSGGEVCPVYDQSGKTVNRFHNDTITACIY